MLILFILFVIKGLATINLPPILRISWKCSNCNATKHNIYETFFNILTYVVVKKQNIQNKVALH